MRCAQQLAVQVVRPGVIGAEDRAVRHHAALDREPRLGAFRRAQPRAAMAAYVVERAQRALVVAHEQNALTAHIEHAMIAGLRQFFLASDAHPFPEEDVFLLERVDILALVPERGQGGLQAAGQVWVRGGHVGFSPHARRPFLRRASTKNSPNAAPFARKRTSALVLSAPTACRSGALAAGKRRLVRRMTEGHLSQRLGTTVAIGLLLCAPAFARPLDVEDRHRLQSLTDPQISPDGAWVAYCVSTSRKDPDVDEDDIWLVSWNGRQSIRLTNTPSSEHSPRWSPDGHLLAFLTDRGDEKAG